MNFLQNLSPVWQATIASLFTCLMTTAGAFVIFFTDKPKKSFSVIAESSAAGIMLAASFFSLLSPAFEYPCAIPPYVAVTLGFCIGGGVIILTDRLFARSARMSEKGDRKSRLLYAAVTLHNIPEGMAVGLAFSVAGREVGHDVLAGAIALAIGMGLQNFPEGAAISLPLRSEGMSKGKSFVYGALSGVVEPVFGLLTVLVAGSVTGIMPWVLSFAAGAMIYVVVEELIPEAHLGEHSHIGTISVMAGFLIMMILDVALG